VHRDGEKKPQHGLGAGGRDVTRGGEGWERKGGTCEQPKKSFLSRLEGRKLGDNPGQFRLPPRGRNEGGSCQGKSNQMRGGTRRKKNKESIYQGLNAEKKNAGQVSTEKGGSGSLQEKRKREEVRMEGVGVFPKRKTAWIVWSNDETDARAI